jgi:hypothetical protein
MIAAVPVSTIPNGARNGGAGRATPIRIEVTAVPARSAT